jgi:hypothetical protein
MRLVLILWRQTGIECPTTGADAFNDTVIRQQAKNAVDGHPINRAAPFQDGINVARLP